MAKLRLKDFERDLNLNPITEDELAERLAPWAHKYLYFRNCGYKPHTYQILAHTSTKRFTVMGAGRRGGKTVSAAWESAYLANPETQRDALRQKGVEVFGEDRVILGAIVMPDNVNYKATPRLFTEALTKMLGKEGEGFQWNKNDNIIYIPNRINAKSIVHFKSAEEGRKLRGEGYSWTWWDEPAFIKSREAWEAFEPAISDLIGCAIFSTTPGNEDEMWWFYDEFIDPDKLDDDIEYIEWFSIENPHYPRKEWERLKRRKHPIEFRREYMAQWDKSHGKVLKLPWLSKWAFDLKAYDPQTGEGFHMKDGKLDPDHYHIVAGMDLAIAEKANSDFTAISVIAIDKKTGNGYLIYMMRKKLDFPSQIDALNYINLAFKPLVIGIEAVGYQRALAQQVSRSVEMAPIIEVQAKGKKAQRIMTMSPFFRSGKFRVIRPDNIQDEETALAVRAFWDEWAEFTMDDKHKHDDTLDATEIATRILPFVPGVDLSINQVHNDESRGLSKAELAHKEISELAKGNFEGYDDAMGDQW